MTMANATVTSSPPRTGASLRKTNKPLMEKRRRARINDSLTQLKSLVIQSSKKDSSQFNKLEKADILELTVKHLRNLQSQQQQQQQQLSQAGNNDPSLAGKYQAGFLECANEVIRYLGQSQGFSDDIKARVIGHLASCLQLSNKPSFTKPVQPSNMTPTNTTILTSGQPVASAPNGQFTNGQIIQIVNSPFQSIKSSPMTMTQFPASQTVQIAPVLSSNLPTSATASSSSPHISSVVRPTSATTTTTPNSPSSSESSHYVRYSQPLRIQIPPVLSPVLIQTHSQPQLSPQPTHAPQNQMSSRVHDPAPQPLSHLPTPPQETTVPSTTPSPHSQEIPMSPPHRTLPRPHPTHIHDDLPSDLLTRSRTYSVTSSSSSSESDLVSPLNLSQSPPYYDIRKESLSSKYASLENSHHPRACVRYEKLSPSHRVLRERDNVVPSQFHPSSYTSVIVDGRKTLDSQALKYMNLMMEDERHCHPHEGSTSPASSVGEERLWRPW